METRRRRADRSPEKRVKPKKEKKKKYRVLKIIGLAVLFLILIGGAIYGKVYLDIKKASNHAYQTIERQTQAQLPNLKNKSSFTFLFLGVDDKVANDILVLTVNPKQNKTTVISLNRDIYLESEKTTLKNLYGSKGVAGEIDALQNLLAVEISRYVTFDMGGLGEFVEAVGGIEVANETNFIANGYQFKPRTLTLKTTDEVKAFLTKVVGEDEDEATAEKELVNREQSALMAVIPKMKSISTVLNYKKFVDAFSDNIKTDFAFDELQILGFDYNGVLGQITKENLKTSKTRIDGKEKDILPEEQITKARERIVEALNE
ncbi:MAG: LCP family protein [Streptococcaceae bacterium]|jgi:anionic cell wall polymer biosynthesis LytR-Cps2A-Psr (LCP) family protein|nr:LCP family protein [Streptococcaceae bacterium]